MREPVNRTLRSHDLYLKNHPAVASFCDSYRRFHGAEQTQHSRKFPVLSPFTIVCERKEDVLAVRAQVFHELNILPHTGEDDTAKGPALALSGITTYTLDSLARSFGQWALLALRQLNRSRRSPELLGLLSHEALARPFLDIVTQEKLVRQILYACGYAGSDALPLAKQILALIDHPLPEGTGLAQFLHPLESRHIATPMDEAYLSSAALLLCALQIAERYLDTKSFARAQTLLRKGFLLASQSVLEELVSVLPPAVAALSGTLLWLEAPRYGFDDTPVGAEYKPGNYAADVSADLLEVCKSLRQINHTNANRAKKTTETQVPHECIIGETVITAASERKIHAQTAIERIVLHGTLVNLYVHARNTAQPDALFLLGDVPLDHTRILHPAAAGGYSICEAEIDCFLAQKLHASEANAAANPSLQLSEASLAALEGLWEEHVLLEEMLTIQLPLFRQIAGAYGLDSASTNSADRFRFAARDLATKTRSSKAESEPLEAMPQALSFLPTAQTPNKVVVFGKPHASRQPSFNVRILNQIFFELRKQGTLIATPASDIMYRVFWRSLFLGPKPVTLHLVEPSEVQELERILKLQDSLAPLVESPRQRALLLGGDSHGHVDPALGEANILLLNFLRLGTNQHQPATCPNWAAIRNRVREARSLRPVPDNETTVTAFEDYTSCPFLFYLRHVLMLGSKTADSLSYDRLDSGTRMHTTLELLSSTINFALTHPDYPLPTKIALVEEFFHGWLARLRVPDTFMSMDSTAFKNAAADTLGQIRSRSTEAPFSDLFFMGLLKSLGDTIDALFAAQHESLSDTLGTETRKRMLITFLEAELAQLQKDRSSGELRRIAHIEKPVTIELGTHAAAKLCARGKIDRIDHLYERQGTASSRRTRIEIIDYKTSAPKEQHSFLSIFPNQRSANSNKSKSQSSVQGGLYLAALHAELNMENGHSESDSRVTATVSETVLPLTFSLYRIGSLKGTTDPILSASLDLQTAEGRDELAAGIGAYDRIADELLAGQFPANPLDAALCHSCEFRVQCPGAPHARAALEDSNHLKAGRSEEALI